MGLADINQPFCLSLKERLLHLLERLRHWDKIKYTHFFCIFIVISTHDSFCQQEAWIYLYLSVAGGCLNRSLGKKKACFSYSIALKISTLKTHRASLYTCTLKKRLTGYIYIYINKPANHRLHMHAQILHSKDTGGGNVTHRTWEILIGCQQLDVCLQPISLPAHSPLLTSS